jgi:predicted enzyme related to lactoylglutathione lyase
MSGEVIHFEIPVDDEERARGFYAQAFGWRMNYMPGMGYTLVGTAPTDAKGMPTKPGTINGGMLKRQAPVHHPLVTIQVADIDATLKTVEGLGGAVARGKFAVASMGFAAYFKDSEGNIIGLWQNAT